MMNMSEPIENHNPISRIDKTRMLPGIANLFQRIDYIEKMGTGIERIRQTLKETNVPTVQYELNPVYVKAIFQRPVEIPAQITQEITQEIGQTTQETTQEIDKEAEEKKGRKWGVSGEKSSGKGSVKSSEKTVEKTVEETANKILIAMQKNPRITSRQLASITGLTRSGMEY